MHPTRRARLSSYGVAILATAIALLFSLALRPIIERVPFILFFAALAASVGYGGLWPGLLTTLLSVALVNYFFLPPLYMFSLDSQDALVFGLFLLTAFVINWVYEARRRAEITERDQRDWLQTILTSIGDAVITTDTAGRITFVNPIAATLTGWRHEEAVGKAIDDVLRLVNEETQQPVQNPVAKVLLENRIVGLANHTILISRDGTRHPLDASGAPIRDAAGNIQGAVLVFRDITERKRAERFQRFLLEVSAALASSLDYETTLNKLARLLVPELADNCVIDVVDDGGILQRIAVAATDPAREEVLRELMRRYPPDPQSMVTRPVVGTQQPRLVARLTDEFYDSVALNPEHAALMRASGGKSMVVMPLIAHERSIGAITVATVDSGRYFSEADLPLIQELASRASLALENARLYRRSQQAEADQRLLANAGEVLSSSLNYEQTLKNVGRLVVPSLADWCGVSTVADDGYSLTVTAITHSDPEMEAWAYQVANYFPVNLDSPYPSVEALRSGEVRLVAEIPPDTMNLIEDLELREALVRLNLQSVLYVPLMVREHKLGVLTLSRTAGRKRFAAQDVPLVQELGHRIAIAIDNAHLYRRAHEQRERLRVTLSSIGDAVIATDEKEQITFMNPVAVELTGWREEEAIGQDIQGVFCIINEESRQTVESPVTRVIREGTIVGLANHTVLITKDGRDIPIDDSGAPIRDGSGTIIGVILVFRDISKRKEAELEQARLHQQAIQASNRTQRLQAVTAALARSLTMSEVAAAFVDLAIQAIGAAAGSLVQLAGDSMLELVEANQNQASLVQSLRRFSLDSPVPLAEAVRTATSVWIDSHESWAARYAAPPISPQYRSWAALPLVVEGKTLGGIGFGFAESRNFSDEDKALLETLATQCAQAVERAHLYSEVQAHAELLERRVNERTAALQDAVSRAQAADQAKSLMLSNVTHEMRTPLSSIVGFSNLLLQRPLPEDKRREFTRVINAEGRRLTMLVDNFLDLQRIIAGRQVFRFAPLDFAALIPDVLSTYPLGEDSKHQIETDLSPIPSIYADSDHMRRVILNLLSNAIKYSPQGGIIRLSLRHNDQEVAFSITDPGIGIPPSEVSQLFERFQRGTQAEQLRIQGTGLGLALSKEIIDAHQGRIWAESAGPGHGTTFHITLPLVWEVS